VDKRRVAIESSLDNMRDYLAEKGYEVVQLDPHTQTGIELKNCDAVLISGMDDNLMGMTTIKTESPVIDVKGMSPSEVLNRLEQTFHRV
jgi:hypothetical protein